MTIRQFWFCFLLKSLKIFHIRLRRFNHDHEMQEFAYAAFFKMFF